MTNRVNMILPDVRWAICALLYQWGESGCHESSIQKVCQKMKYEISFAQIKEQIFYLKSNGYCTVEKLLNGSLYIMRTATLIDLYEYREDHKCPDGINRPPQDWFKL